MNISKTIAEEAAKELIQPMVEKEKKIRKEIGEIAYAEALKTFPKDLLECYNKHISYFHSTKDVTFRNGTQELNIGLSKHLPCEYSSWKFYANIGSDIAHKLSKMDIQAENIKNKREHTQESIYSTLLSLRSFKKIKEQFPEAYELIKKYEEKSETSVSLPIDSILATIRQYK